MKKIVCNSLMAAMLLTVATAAQAQISFGPRVGLNLSNIHFDMKEGDGPKTKMLIGAQFGMALNARFGNLSVQPALLYSMKGCKTDDTFEATSTAGGQGVSISSVSKTPITGTTSLGYVEIPINLMYTTGGDKGFQVFAGPYIGFGIGGKDKTDATKSTITTTTTLPGVPTTTTTSSADIAAIDSDVVFKSDVKDGDDPLKSYYSTPDFGLNFGIGYLVNNVQVQAGYGLGLSNLMPKYAGKTPDDKGQNRVIQITGTYFFNAN
jgi:Outer membrane protein beta-barrel domain